MTTTNGTNTATVQTLTAEVRVLQVGNRQITLSVVKQLDRCRYEELEPMGRVRSGRKDKGDTPDDGECYVEVVGRHRETGALMFAYAPGPEEWTPQEWQHWMFHAHHTGTVPPWPYRELGYRYHLYTVIDQDGHALVWTLEGSDPCPIADGYKSPVVDTPEFATYAEQHEWRVEHRDRRDRGELCGMPALEAVWRQSASQQHAESVRALKLRAEAEALPLIVLAGLK